MTRFNLILIDQLFRLMIFFLKIIIKSLTIVSFVCKYLAKLLIVLLMMMVLDKLSIIDMFARYYFKEMMLGTLCCILIYGFSIILKMFINDDCLYQLECSSDNFLRSLINRNKYIKKTIPKVKWS